MSTKSVVKAILKDLYKNRDTLAGNKFSGVHYINDTYRIHMTVFIPRVIDVRVGIYDIVAEVIAETFGEKAEWDEMSLWLTFLD